MNTQKFKYNKNFIRHRLVNCILFFSVFAFSGFTPQIHSAFHETFRIELVESRIREADYSLKSINKTYTNSRLVSIISDIRSQSHGALLHYNNVLRTKLRSYRIRILFYRISSLFRNFTIRSLSSEDCSPPLFAL